MYVDSCTQTVAGRTYTRHLLRESYREGGRVKHRTVANISHCSPAEIAALRLALQHKNDLSALSSSAESIRLQQGRAVGAVWVLHSLAQQIGLTDALGHSRQGKLALWQVIARVLDQGSRLSAVRLAARHAACDVLNVAGFNEDHLYDNLDWLAQAQADIETRLLSKLHPSGPPGLYLYDVTSTYLEGAQNELAAFGYNRDGKQGKRQLVIGLLCDEVGQPLSIEVFTGNTQDPKTVASQIDKVVRRFGAKGVTFVGDRGMIKSGQVHDLLGEGFHYITAITKPQIESLLQRGALQMSLFDQSLAEVIDDGVRYVLRRNALRAAEVRAGREDKLASARRLCEATTRYLAEHPRARLEVAAKRCSARAKSLKIDKFVAIEAHDRQVSLSVMEEARLEVEKLDGCYVLKTDLPVAQASKDTIHDRYKDLSLVEWAFRNCKTVELEMRPVNVRLASRTRGHMFVVMLAYRLVKELAARWRELNVTVGEGLQSLSLICATEVTLADGTRLNQIPEPDEQNRRLLEAASVQLPQALPCKGIAVATRKTLPQSRARRRRART